jgi:ACS family allantoate permease-like MFS transporter
MAVCMAAEVLTIMVWKFWLVYKNKQRAQAIAAEGLSPEEVDRKGQELGALDVTDLKNPYFM